MEVASPSCKRVSSKSAGYDCVNNATVPQGRLRHQRACSAGYDCVNNATVPQGRLRNQRNVAQKPWGGPPSCDPAPLTTSLRGLWVSGNAGTGQWLLRTKGRRPKNRPSDTRGGDPKTDLRKEELSKQLGREGRGPKDPGVEAPLAAAGCRGNCRRVLDGLDLTLTVRSLQYGWYVDVSGRYWRMWGWGLWYSPLLSDQARDASVGTNEQNYVPPHGPYVPNVSVASHSSGGVALSSSAGICEKGRKMAFHHRFRNHFERGNYRKFFPARFVCVCAQTQENGVSSPFPNVPFQYVLRTFSGKRFHRFSFLRRFTQTVPRLRRTVPTLFCWILCTARSSLPRWSTSCCGGKRDVKEMWRYIAPNSTLILVLVY